MGYQHLGNGLQTQFNIVVYTPDTEYMAVRKTCAAMLPDQSKSGKISPLSFKLFRAEFPQVPLFFSGHSSGAGLALNYASPPDREHVRGYLFLSPQLGTRAQTDRPSLSVPFAKVDVSASVANAMSGGTAHGHDSAVQFNYSAEILASVSRIVNAITVNMALALTPSAPHKQLAVLESLFCLCFGSDDELFLPDKVLAFADLSVSVRTRSQVSSILNANHLLVLLRAHEIIGPQIVKMI